MRELKKLFWRFYWNSGNPKLSGIHCANTDEMWTQVFGRLMFQTDKGHPYQKVVMRVLK